jgi:hypothetical protein
MLAFNPMQGGKWTRKKKINIARGESQKKFTGGKDSFTLFFYISFYISESTQTEWKSNFIFQKSNPNKDELLLELEISTMVFSIYVFLVPD